MKGKERMMSSRREGDGLKAAVIWEGSGSTDLASMASPLRPMLRKGRSR